MLAAERAGVAVTRMLIRFRRAPARTVGRQRSVQYPSAYCCSVIPAVNVRIDRFYEGRAQKKQFYMHVNERAPTETRGLIVKSLRSLALHSVHSHSLPRALRGSILRSVLLY